MKLRNIILGLCLIASSSITATYAQEGAKIGIQIGVGSTTVGVTDKDSKSDGFTVREKSDKAIALKLNYEKPITESLSFQTGLWFNQKTFTIRNTDGNWSGKSTYQTSYLQIPLLLTINIADVADKIGIYANGGITLDVNAGQKLIGKDEAHYWNLANNDTNADQTRGANGNGKAINLFGPFDASLYLGGGVTYDLSDKAQFMLGLSYNQGLFNNINGKLLFNDKDTSKVADDIKITTGIIALDLGFRFSL